MASPPLDIHSLPAMARIDDAVRAAYRNTFLDAMAEGAAKPLSIPYSVLGAFIVPTLWLTIPHTNSQLLYQTRWPVMAFVVWFNIQVSRYSSSTNFACAYAAGLMSSWGIILALHLLIWRRPQFEAARVIAVAKYRMNGENGHSANGSKHKNPDENGLRNRKQNGSHTKPPSSEKKGETEDEMEYVWEPFPSQAPFLYRLGWAADLATSFRGAGWNWSIGSIPRPAIPKMIQRGDKVDVNSIPREAVRGYWHCLTEGQFLRTRLVNITIACFLLDFLAVFMMKDPYFIFGPDNSYTLPDHLRQVSPWLLLFYRELFSLVAVWSAIQAVFNSTEVVQYWTLKAFFPSRAALWHYSSVFGSFSHVANRGLAGWWGSCWHQTFRLPFLAPYAYFERKGYIKHGTAEAVAFMTFLSFFQSGLMHFAGSMTTIPQTKPWRSLLFFILQGVGIAVQQGLTKATRRYIPNAPRRLSQAGNLVFSVLWLYATAPLFIDDLASTGLWLLEPVPISLLRWLGLGHPDDHWWRWDREFFPKFYPVNNWWEFGIAL